VETACNPAGRLDTAPPGTGCSVAGEQHGHRQRSAASAGHRELQVAIDLRLFRLAPQLPHGFADIAKRVGATGGDLPAIGVDGEYAIPRDAMAAFQIAAAFADGAKAQRLDPL